MAKRPTDQNASEKATATNKVRAPSEHPQPVKRPASQVKDWIKSLTIALAIFLLLRTFLVEAFRIPSGSMENTLLIGDFLFVNKALYGAEIPFTGVHLPALRDPRRGDLVIFKSVEEERLTVVKRVIGMPGDTLSMESNQLFVNGTARPEPYVVLLDPLNDPEDPKMRAWQVRYLSDDRNPRAYRPTLKNWGPIVVPADSFFLMGDNRDRSYDSRYWGFVGRDRIRGHPMLVYYSYDKTGLLPLPFITGIRWKRILATPD